MNCETKNKQKRILLKGTEKYDKITYRDKILLLKKVLIDREQIKETSQELSINYSTAKTFLRKFRTKCTRINADFIQNVCQWFEQHRQSSLRCAYRGLLELQERGGKDTVVSVEGATGQGMQVCSPGQKMFANEQSKIEIIQQVLFQ